MVDFMGRNRDHNKPAGGPHGRLSSVAMREELDKVLNLDPTGSFKPVDKWKKRTTLLRWVRRHDEERSITERVRAPQRRAINEDQLNNMIVSYQESPFTPTRTFAQEYEVSMQTIRNELH